MTADHHATALTDFVLEAHQALQIPGVAVGVLHGGQRTVVTAGVTNLDHPLPVDRSTLFQIGSISKTLTGTLLMQLVEQGRLDLEAPVRTYLPQLRLADETVAGAVRLRHLVSHVAGWRGDFFIDTGTGDDALARYVERMAELPQLTPLATAWSYNNAAFALAGRVIEVVTGQPFETAARALLLDPLGLKRTTYWPAEVVSERVAAGHLRWPDGQRVARPWALARWVGAVGGLICHVDDLLTYAAFHLGDGAAPNGRRLLSQAGLLRMRAPLAHGGLMAEATGVSWMLRHIGGALVVEHGGATHGQTARLTLVPERDFAVAVLTNEGRGAALHGRIAAWAIERYLGLTTPAPIPMAVPAERLTEVAGTYTATLTHVKLAVVDGELQLAVQPQGHFPFVETPPGPAPAPARAALTAADQLMLLDTEQAGSRGELLRDDHGRIAWLRFGGRLHARQPEIIPTAPV